MHSVICILASALFVGMALYVVVLAAMAFLEYWSLPRTDRRDLFVSPLACGPESRSEQFRLRRRDLETPPHSLVR